MFIHRRNRRHTRLQIISLHVFLKFFFFIIKADKILPQPYLMFLDQCICSFNILNFRQIVDVHFGCHVGKLTARQEEDLALEGICECSSWLKTTAEKGIFEMSTLFAETQHVFFFAGFFLDNMATDEGAATKQTNLSSTTLFVRNLPFVFDNKELEKVFSEVGPIKRCFVVKDTGTLLE